MEQEHKSYATAYFLWLLVGLFAGHRFYLAQAASAILFIAAHAAAWGILFLSQHQQDENMAWGGLLMLAAVYAWMIVDLIFIPSMADKFNEKLDEKHGPYMGGPVSMDAGFQATLKKAGLPTEDGRRKAAIPEDYVLPWRREGGGGSMPRDET